MGSLIADNIMQDYQRKKRYEANKLRSEIEKFHKENCYNCKNKNTDICEIRKDISGKLKCVYKEV